MPNLNQTGPLGEGPMTGRAMGRCGKHSGRGMGRCFNPGRFASFYEKPGLSDLEEEEKILEANLERVRKEKENLDKE